jgi:tetratricopeptide (TPR) repeat protein
MRTALVLAILCAGVVRAAEPSDAEASVLMQQATVAHKHAQQTKDPKDYEAAAKLYEQYFARPAHPEEHAMSFYYAELLFRMQRYDDAAKYYERTVTVDPKGKFAKEAAYASMISMKNAMRSPVDDGGKPPCPEMKPCPIPNDAQRLVAAFDRYLTIVPESPERSNVEYRRARIYYGYQHFAEAASQFDHILVAYPDHEFATYSANLEMDCLAILKRYDELRALVERVKKNPVLMKDATTQQQVRDNDAALKKHGK